MIYRARDSSMQKQQAGHYVLLTLVTILTFVLLVASETNQNVALDARDIAVSEKILPASEVKRVIFTHCTVLYRLSLKGEGLGQVLDACRFNHEQL